MLKSVLQPPFETTPLAAPQPDRHVKTLAERASEQRALYLARPNSVNHRSLWSAICDERHCCYGATRKGGLAHRRAAAAAAFPDRNCFPAQIHRRWLRISIRRSYLPPSLPPSLPPACAVRKAAAGGFCGLLRKSHGNIFLGSPAFHRDILLRAGCTFYLCNSNYKLCFRILHVRN